MELIAFLIIVAVVTTSVSFTKAGDAEPCLASNIQNISHIYERYAKLNANCQYTDDHRIEGVWVYAGEDPILTFPPDYCSCGYRFPIWMNGTMPSQEDGVVNRTACLKYEQPCHQELIIQIRNCGTFFLYHLTQGQAASGYCFGVDKPEPYTTTPTIPNIPKATVTIEENTVTVNSFISRINVSANNDDFNITAELVRSDGLVLQSIALTESFVYYKWQNLSSATNYTIIIYALKNGEMTEIASTWKVTDKLEMPYRQSSAYINILKNSTSNNSISVITSFDPGSENTTGEFLMKTQNGSVVMAFGFQGSISFTLSELDYGTQYIFEIYMYRHGKRIQLAQKLAFTEPEIEVFLGSKQVGDKTQSFTVIECKFDSSPEAAYSVQWFVQSKERNHTITKTVEVDESIQKLYLTAEDLVNNHISLPFYVSCSVSEVQQEAGDFSPFSQNMFAGIKILTPKITLHRDETAAILFSPTIPIGCSSLQTTSTENCNLTLSITIPVSNNCTGISTRGCTVTVSGTAGSNSSLQIQATEDGQYGIQKDSTHKVILRTIHLLNDSIWSDYTLPAVTVVVKPEMETYWRGKVCEALNDPHMYTFDKKAYEHHESLADEFVMYTHENYNAKIHHKLERCNSIAMCNCGVAVQAGRDLYMISTCNNILEIGYKQCDDGVLLVKQDSDSIYTIYFPYGTYVKARLDKSPYSGVSMIVSVSVFPSVHDQNGRSKGLCGTLDNIQANDFHDRSGKPGLTRVNFIQAWKVSEKDSLFVVTPKSSQPWMHPACACTVSNGHITKEDTCQLGANNSCTKGKSVGQQVCKLAEKIPINSFNGLNVPALNLTKETNHKGHEMISTPATTKRWNFVEANSFCMAFLNKSRTFRLCKRVPYTDTDRAIETCTQDIIITQTTTWHEISRQSMQDACLSEIHRNKTVREHFETPKKTTSPPTPPSGQHMGHVTPVKSTVSTIDSNLDINELVDEIEKITCPNDCSENGRCNKGTCKCNVGFGRDDCSMDLTKPPSATNFLHGSVCDEKEAPCTHVFIHGGFFASETVSCHITTFETHAGKEGRQNLDAYVIRGQTQSLIEVICPLTSQIRRRRSIPDTKDAKLLSCYIVAVSNDGIHHGSPITMCVYNSQCHILFNGSDGLLTADIKKGFCYIDGKCVPANARRSSLETFCLPALSLYSWSEFPTNRTALSSSTTSATGILLVDKTKNSWQTPVIIAVSCTCGIILIVGLVVFIRKKTQRITQGTNKDENGLELSKKYDADFDDETYAHINPTDVSDNMSHGNKTLDLTGSDTTNEYCYIDTSNKEKTQYSMLNSTQNIRTRDGPMLPGRDVSIPGDPYEKLRAQNREQRQYYRIGNNSRNVEPNDKQTNSNENRNLSDKMHSYNLDNRNYLTPRDGVDEASSGVKRYQSEREKENNDDYLEGYERPDPQYRPH